MNTKIQELKKELGDRAKENEILAPYTTFKIGGPADLFYEASTVEELASVVSKARKTGVPVFIFGGGSNILIGDNGIRGFVIKNNAKKIIMKGAKGTYGRDSNRQVYVEAESGVIMNKLVRDTIEEGLAGLEMHLGLPGTVGGALFMNSKWTHPAGFVGDTVCQATILRSNGDIDTVSRDYFRFGYDTSSLQNTGDIVLSVVFILNQKTKEELWDCANKSIQYRRATQPQGVRTAGCTFKNISRADALSIPTPDYTTSAGFLIDHAGCRGLSVGDVKVSDIHTNFLVNTTGHAKASDVVALIEMIKGKVEESFHVHLEEEIVHVGDF